MEKYCENYPHVKGLTDFHDVVFFAKIPPRENKTYNILLKKQENMEKYCENYLHMKGLTNVFAKVTPSENKHF